MIAFTSQSRKRLCRLSSLQLWSAIAARQWTGKC